MANWKITADHLFPKFGGKSAVGTASVGIDTVEESALTEKFKMYDDDGELYYEGVSDDCMTEGAFAPLDDFGQPNDGCTSIHYLNKKSGRYETL